MWENSIDEIFEGNPIDKWKDIIFNASRGLAEAEIERLLETLAIYELLLEEQDLSVNMRDFFYKSTHDSNLKKQIKERKISIAMESMSKILSENE